MSAIPKTRGVEFTDKTRAGSRESIKRHRKACQRGIDPATCDRIYTDDETEFLAAIEAYQCKTGRKFPTWTEALEVLRGLGYEKVRDPGIVRMTPL